MRRLIYTLTAVIAITFTNTACTMDSSDKQDPMMIGKNIAWAAIPDIRDACSIVETLIHYNEYLHAESDEERAAIAATYLQGYEFTVNHNIHTLALHGYKPNGEKECIPTYVKGDGVDPTVSNIWEVERLFYNPYKLTLTINEDSYHAEFTLLSTIDHKGSGELTMSYNEEHEVTNPMTGNNAAIYNVEGELSMVDSSASIAKPLTLDITIGGPALRVGRQYAGGEVSIICTDKLYNTTDKVDLTFEKNMTTAALNYAGMQAFIQY